ncbi:MAG: acetyltransferase [Proteobacteria bacterium]|nr:MAG: acetyltransferase [Pseudomonadota bacterium]
MEKPNTATKRLDLSGDFGRQVIKSETNLALRVHPKIFQKLADM